MNIQTTEATKAKHTPAKQLLDYLVALQEDVVDSNLSEEAQASKGSGTVPSSQQSPHITAVSVEATAEKWPVATDVCFR